jgi:hypothetical protein
VEIFVFVLSGLLLIVLAMSVGVLLGRKPISGSCGGMAALGMDTACDICGGDKAICDDEDEKQRRIEQLKQQKDGQDASLGYELKSK